MTEAVALACTSEAMEGKKAVTGQREQGQKGTSEHTPVNGRGRYRDPQCLPGHDPFIHSQVLFRQDT